MGILDWTLEQKADTDVQTVKSKEGPHWSQQYCTNGNFLPVCQDPTDMYNVNLRGNGEGDIHRASLCSAKLQKVEKFGLFNFLFFYGNYNHNKYVKKCHLQ